MTVQPTYCKWKKTNDMEIRKHINSLEYYFSTDVICTFTIGLLKWPTYQNI